MLGPAEPLREASDANCPLAMLMTRKFNLDCRPISRRHQFVKSHVTATDHPLGRTRNSSLWATMDKVSPRQGATPSPQKPAMLKPCYRPVAATRYEARGATPKHAARVERPSPGHTGPGGATRPGCRTNGRGRKLECAKCKSDATSHHRRS